ncbi:hypothetical protein JXA88_18230 [Candidatus Fermentibacteria bacterium]|nr:hypothetical protein [Candidatus Fermentibacteria bacterium]
MIWPALVILRIGKWAWIPIPFLLFWPLLAVLWLASLVRYLLRDESSARSILAAMGAVPRVCAAMNGTRIAVDPADGPAIRVIVV